MPNAAATAAGNATKATAGRQTEKPTRHAAAAAAGNATKATAGRQTEKPTRHAAAAAAGTATKTHPKYARCLPGLYIRELFKIPPCTGLPIPIPSIPTHHSFHCF